MKHRKTRAEKIIVAHEGRKARSIRGTEGTRARRAQEI